MRLRSQNNAASAIVAVVGFVLLGLVIAIGGLAAGFEPCVLWAGLAAYAFIAVPLLIAAFCGEMTSGKNRSFRPTPPAYMVGKRVKPRLWRLATAGGLLAAPPAFGVWVGMIWAIARFPFLFPHDWLTITLSFVIPVVVYYLTLCAFVKGFVSLGWMTRKEGGELLAKGHSWPEAWLEPISEDK